MNKVACVKEDFVDQILKVRAHSNNKQHLVDRFSKCHRNFLKSFFKCFWKQRVMFESKTLHFNTNKSYYIYLDN